MVIEQLAHNQSEYPLASNPQTADTLRLCKLNLTRHNLRGSKSFQQRNTPNRFVPELVWVSLNVSDIQHLGQCVPALNVKLKQEDKIIWQGNSKFVYAELT